MIRPPLAAMAYTVLRPALADLDGTLARLADLGFVGLETYGIVEHFGPARVRKALDAAGLELTSAHTPFPAGERAEEILDQAGELGATTLVWSLEPEEFECADSLRRGVERVNEAAERAAGVGMQIGYHNHMAEFTSVFDGTRAYDCLLALLDPRVLIELDAYWAAFGGADLAALLGSLGDRAQFIHLKDGPLGDYGNDDLVPIGAMGGSIDWPQVLPAGTGLSWHIIELERLNIDVFEALQISRDYLVDSGLSRRMGRPSRVPAWAQSPADYEANQ